MAHDRLTRNLGTLSLDEIEKIAGTRVGIAGCGLGSEVARQLVRFGFTISVLADPDTVELHNLNRQSYHHTHVGVHKVDALLEKLQLINPDLHPKLYREGITEHNYKEFVDQADIVIDAIDPTSFHLSVAITREAHRQGKHVVTALDMGFGARLFVLPAGGMDIMDFMGLAHHITDQAILAMPIQELMAPYIEGMPEYVMNILMSFVSGELDFYPQNMLAVAQAAVLITAACKRLSLGQPVKAIPEYIHIDTDMLLNPAL